MDGVQKGTETECITGCWVPSRLQTMVRMSGWGGVRGWGWKWAVHVRCNCFESSMDKLTD